MLIERWLRIIEAIKELPLTSGTGLRRPCNDCWSSQRSHLTWCALKSWRPLRKS